MAIRAKNKCEARFIGTGNHWNGQYRGWQIKCSRCSTASKVVAAHGGSIAPHMIIRKLEQTGWIVGNSPAQDVCGKCQKAERHDRVGNKLDVAKTAMQAASAPMLQLNGQRCHFSELEAICKTLDVEQARSLIAILQQRIPHRTYQKHKPPEKTTDETYEQWLAEQEKSNV